MQALRLGISTKQGGLQKLILASGEGQPGRLCLQPSRTQEGLELGGTLSCTGQGLVTLSLTLSNMSTEAVEIEEITYGLDLTALLGDTVDLRLQLGEGYREWTAREGCKYVQLSRMGYVSVDGEPASEVNALGGECRINRIGLHANTEDQGLTFAVRNLLENFPVKLEADRKELRFFPWPKEAGVLHFPAGMSKTYEMGLIARTSASSLFHDALTFQFPLVPRIPMERLGLLKSFPPFAPYRPRAYPRLETWFKWMIGNRPRAYGSLHFGDEPNHGYTARGSGRILWTNNEYDYPLIALTQYLRTGGRIAWEDGRAATLHMMDIDSIVADPDPMQVGGQHSHSPGHVTHPAAPDHEWLEGLLMYYLLTDDARALWRAEALADRLLRLTEIGELDVIGQSARRYGWTLIALCAIYGFSSDVRYLEAAGRIVHTMLASEKAYGGLRSSYWRTPYKSLDTFMVGIAGAALSRYYALTGAEEVREAIIRICEALLEMTSPEGILYYKEYPLVRLPYAAVGALSLEVLAYGYRLNGNREYLLAGARNIEQTLFQTEMGLMVDWNAEQRVEVEGGVYLRETVLVTNAQMIGIMLRGIWPFIAVAHEAGIFDGHRNPFVYACDRE